MNDFASTDSSAGVLKDNYDSSPSAVLSEAIKRRKLKLKAAEDVSQLPEGAEG